MTIRTDDENILDGWQRLMEQAATYAKALRDERERLLARVREIDAALAKAPSETVTMRPTEPTPKQAEIDPKMSVPSAVLAVLRAATGPMPAIEIAHAIQVARRDIDTPQVHAALYALKQRGQVIAEGKKGHTTYRHKEAPL